MTPTVEIQFKEERWISNSPPCWNWLRVRIDLNLAFRRPRGGVRLTFEEKTLWRKEKSPRRSGISFEKRNSVATLVRDVLMHFQVRSFRYFSPIRGHFKTVDKKCPHPLLECARVWLLIKRRNRGSRSRARANSPISRPDSPSICSLQLFQCRDTFYHHPGTWFQLSTHSS